MENKQRTILIVDDASMFRELGSLFLARSGRVITARDGEEGLDAVRRERPAVVVADLEMPVLGGDALCAAIRSDPDLSQTPVVITTPGTCAEDHARAVKAGANDVIEKPINRVTLIQSVNRFLRGPELRGLERVQVETPVRIRSPLHEAWGRAINLSRGGMFVASPQLVAPRTEVELEFELPEGEGPIAPTAKVVWSRERENGDPMGMGLQFLAIDRASASRIEAFVYERASVR